MHGPPFFFVFRARARAYVALCPLVQTRRRSGSTALAFSHTPHRTYVFATFTKVHHARSFATDDIFLAGSIDIVIPFASRIT